MNQADLDELKVCQGHFEDVMNEMGNLGSEASYEIYKTLRSACENQAGIIKRLEIPISNGCGCPEDRGRIYHKKGCPLFEIEEGKRRGCLRNCTKDKETGLSQCYVGECPDTIIEPIPGGQIE